MGALEWIQLPNLEIGTGVLGVAEMRNGPGEQILVVKLASGSFRPCLGISPLDESEGAISAFRVVHESALGGWRTRRTPEDLKQGGVIGWVSTDVATAGVFDYLLLAEFSSKDPEGFEAWRAGFYAAMDWPHGFDSFGGDHRVPLFYAQGLAGGGHFPVSELLADGEPVGVEVTFAPRLIDGIDVGKALSIERMPDPEPLSPLHVRVEEEVPG